MIPNAGSLGIMVLTENLLTRPFAAVVDVRAVFTLYTLFFFPRPHPFSDSRRISSQNVENFPPKLEFQAARGLGTHPWLESSCLTRFPGRPLDYKKSTNRILRFNWLKSLSKKVTDSKIIVRPKIKPVFKKTASSPFLAS